MRKVFLPLNLETLWQHMAEEPEAYLYAGGTDLLVKMRAGLINPKTLICLERIEALKSIRDQGEEIFIGAACTHAALLRDPLIGKHFPVLAKALSVLGSPLVRQMGTIGGNLITASPAGDTLPPLVVLNADLELQTKDSSRCLAVKTFIRGPGNTLLGPGEILAGVRLKKRPEMNFHHFEKVGQRKALAIALVSLAAVLHLSDKGIVQEARLAWGSVGPTVVTCQEAETTLEGQPLSSEVLERAAALARLAVSPIDDVRAGADYRRQVAGNLLMRLVVEGSPGLSSLNNTCTGKF
ncbi:MAG: molybdopterin dehydrogenase [Desulfobacca sp.]|nr:molybdopterin dehydrogenase [Desulfobacca sp.]